MNEDGSYSYSNSETGDKITFKLKPNEFLKINDYKADPITTIYKTAEVVEESISQTTATHLAEVEAKKVDSPAAI